MALVDCMGAHARLAPALLCQIVLSPWCRARSLSGRRDAERAAAVRSRKASPAIPRGDFLSCDPRKSVYHRRISAPGTCRPHASVVAARAEGYELGALSRRAERRQPLRLLVLQKPGLDKGLTKQYQTKLWEYLRFTGRLSSKSGKRGVDNAQELRLADWTKEAAPSISAFDRRPLRRLRRKARLPKQSRWLWISGHDFSSHVTRAARLRRGEPVRTQPSRTATEPLTQGTIERRRGKHLHHSRPPTQPSRGPRFQRCKEGKAAAR